eukprot:gb/GEZN01004755.1/.p1 GENE.gb/GEZN01004755.1/~~gb/GEZN01004755.1/.p1  ORF type:complete len:575 (-),score=130.48 gb/GEZN01004755.1/:135-1859(-)
MASIADTFLADFESSGEEDELEDELEDKGLDEFEPPVEEEAEIQDLDLEENGGDVQDLDEEDGLDKSAAATATSAATSTEHGEKTAVSFRSFREFSSLIENKSLLDHLSKIAELQASTENEFGVVESIDRDLEYDVIVNSNELAGDIDNEIANVHKFIRDIYSTKYQELEQLVPNPLEYAQVVKIIGNQTDMSTLEGDLSAILPSQVVLTILVTATTTIGKPLPPEDLKKCTDAAEAIITLNNMKTQILEYVESRMGLIAPNLSQIIGADIAALLMAAAGGLKQLSEIPSCNLQVLGKTDTALAGFARSKGYHMGILAESDLILGCPPVFRQRALRLLAAKCILASRTDSHLDKDNSVGALGIKLREDIEKKIKKWQEPPPPKPKKALAAPLPPPKKKRGGKKRRAEKEKYRTTELSKQKNRMMFNKEEMTDEYTGEGFGMIGVAGGGSLAFKNEKKVKLAKTLSRKTQARLNRVRTTRGISGMSSSIAFTPVEGIELVDTDATRRKLVEGAGNRYFAETTGFMKVGDVLKRKREQDAFDTLTKKKIQAMEQANALLKSKSERGGRPAGKKKDE